MDLVFILLLLPALVLWLIPKTRRSGGSVVTAWKTVPFGCVTMLVLPNVLMALLFFLGKVLGLPILPFYAVLSFAALLFSIFVGIRVIAGMKNYIRKRYGAADGAEPESQKPYYVAFICLALTAVIAVVLFIGYFVLNIVLYLLPVLVAVGILLGIVYAVGYVIYALLTGR